MRLRSRGFTLVELLIALIVFVIVGGSMYKVLNTSQRTARTQTEKASMQSGLRTGLQLAVAEIQELWADGGAAAITTMATTDLVYDAMRGIGYSCSVPTLNEIRLVASSYTGVTTAGNLLGYGVYVYDEPDEAWVPARISLVTVIPNGCPDGITDALRLDLTANLPGPLTDYTSPGPVRTFERMRIAPVVNQGRTWLGIGREDWGEDPVPLAGPLADVNGLVFEYYDGSNTLAGTPASVRSIRMTLIGETERATNNTRSGSATEILTDTVTVKVQLRNAR
jgi:prepilin-type N-terminal cleavage/methylation domain-containing protein